VLGSSLLGDSVLLLLSCCLSWVCLFLTSWFNFGRSSASRNLFISSRFSSLLEYKFQTAP
jgi:hypothetical protein